MSDEKQQCEHLSGHFSVTFKTRFLGVTLAARKSDKYCAPCAMADDPISRLPGEPVSRPS
jgi:hypothetical protein